MLSFGRRALIGTYTKILGAMVTESTGGGTIEATVQLRGGDGYMYEWGKYGNVLNLGWSSTSSTTISKVCNQRHKSM